MNPREKAKELVDRFYHSKECNLLSDNEAKQCALICVDEIIKTQNLSLADMSDEQIPPMYYLQFWQQVKEEIEKL